MHINNAIAIDVRKMWAFFGCRSRRNLEPDLNNTKKQENYKNTG